MNSPFPSSVLPPCLNESLCETVNVFNLHVHFHANQTPFRMKSFARRLVLRRRQTRTRKWAIEMFHCMAVLTSFLSIIYNVNASTI